MNYSKHEKMEQPSVSRVYHFTDALLIDALRGLVKRYGEDVIGADEASLRRLVEENIPEKDKVKDNFFWAVEILKELRYRRDTGRISWPPTE